MGKVAGRRGVGRKNPGFVTSESGGIASAVKLFHLAEHISTRIYEADCQPLLVGDAPQEEDDHISRYQQSMGLLSQ
ncbi:jg11449 [Pararge aegeria aegeria]|uniref:Jg11449 protein n=1 Tax=Pararge aegeria aegeria TaxID=348720 RepID=A0A8S4RZJ7_9NEOP|nr:jg11449 [Pararge aegeria aegeria]